jgi:GWxTD domain-containing protein
MRASALFGEAATAEPTSAGAFRGLAMVYTARNRWLELAALGRSRVRLARDDPWGWMAQALAEHRLGDPITPVKTFDSALVRFDSTTRHRLDHVERVMNQPDSVDLTELTRDAYEATVQLYWTLSDPLWSIPGTEPRTEFLARLAYAELRFTTPELDELGTESDRGRTFVRYGPANSILTYVVGLNDPERRPMGMLVSKWNYGSVGLFEFEGFDRLKYSEEEFVTYKQNDTPVRWDNIKHITIDSMPVQVARFRARWDSVDVVVAQLAPVAALQRASVLTTPPNAHLWIMKGGITSVAQGTRQVDMSGVTSFRARVPLGTFIYRTEATAEGASMGGRATGIIVAQEDPATGFGPDGFGMSDVLVAESVRPTVPTPLRWSDFDGRLVTERINPESELSLIWENYEFGNDGGTARYSVSIIIERERSQPGRIAAGIVRGIAGAVGIEQSADKIEMTFDREVPHRAELVDYIGLSLKDTPTGRYTLTVRVVDQVGQRGTAWSRRIVLE